MDVWTIMTKKKPPNKVIQNSFGQRTTMSRWSKRAGRSSSILDHTERQRDSEDSDAIYPWKYRRRHRRISYWKNGMALLPPSSQELPPLPPPLVSPSKGSFSTLSSAFYLFRFFFPQLKLSFLLVLFSPYIHRSGGRFHHIWRRVLQAFVPEASFPLYPLPLSHRFFEKRSRI